MVLQQKKVVMILDDYEFLFINNEINIFNYNIIIITLFSL